MRARVARAGVSLLLAAVCAMPVAARDDARDLPNPPTPDEQFRRARELAWGGRRGQARELCREILEAHPGYHDARVLLGRLDAWDHDYDAARRELRQVLEAEPGYADARSALVDVELWSGRPAEALAIADEGLALDPRNADLLYGRARVLERLRRYDEAAGAVEAAIEAAPARDDLRRLARRLYDRLLVNRLSVDYEVESFEGDFETWHEVDLEYRRAYGFGPVLWRVNLARRFGEDGVQLEVDAYPVLSAGTYLYLNAGVSSSDIFPDVRLGAEVCHGLPRGFEASGGARYLDFDATRVTILTGSIAKYHRRWWISLRPSWVGQSGGDGNSASGELELRRYLGGRYEYWAFAVGGGVRNEENVVTGVQDSLDSLRASFEVRKKAGTRWLVKGTLGFRRQEFRAGATRDSVFAGLGFYRFWGRPGS